MSTTYKLADSEFQKKIQHHIGLLRTEKSELSRHQIAHLLEIAVSKDLEHLYISRLRTYVFIFMVLFTISCVCFILTGFAKKRSGGI